MAEALGGYPRWQGALTKAPAFLAITGQELRRVARDKWATAALVIFVALSAIGFQVRSGGDAIIGQLTGQLGVIEWGALAVASIAAGPALLADAQHNALELYYSRRVKRRDYLLGKTLAVWLATFLSVAFVGLVLYGSAWLTVDDLPGAWNWAWLGILGHAVIWSTVISAVGLGLSAVLRSSRAATIVLFGGVLALDIIISNIMAGPLTNDARWQALSPIAMMHSQNEWLFPAADNPFEFPWWWGALGLAGLSILGWALVAWRHPRLKGVD